jgi:hypothetical protein
VVSATSLQIEKAGSTIAWSGSSSLGGAVDDEVQFMIRRAPQVLTSPGYEPALDSQVVATTSAFLIRRQLAADLRDVVDPEDVVAVYEDYLDELSKGL